MKMKKIMSICALACALAFSASCKKDDGPKADWKSIPSEIITAESGNATLSVNEVPVLVGNAKFTANGASTGILTLTNVIPGYTTVPVSVEMKNVDENTFSFTGKTSLSEGPAIISLKSEALASVYSVEVDGTVTVDGKISVNASTHVSAQGGLAGTWKIKRTFAAVEGETGITPSGAPIWLKWKINDEQFTSLSSLASLAGIFGGAALGDYLDHVTFNENGNITAGYWKDAEDEDFDINKFFALAPTEPDANGNFVFGNDHEDKWLESPAANLAFWHAGNGVLYVSPDIMAIAAAADADSPSEEEATTTVDISELISAIKDLADYGVDVPALTSEVMKILQNGIALKYTVDGNNLTIYVDKALCDPIVKPLLPALKVLDQKYEELLKSEDPADQQTAEMIGMVFGMCGITKPSDFETIWNATDEFEISLSFEKAE